MNRGDVVRAQLPRPRGQPGHEQFGTRPAVVIQDESDFSGFSTVVIVPLTSRKHALRFSGAFTIAPSDGNGLTTESIALTHQIRAIDRLRIEAVIGTLSLADQETLDHRLRQLLRI